MDRFFRLSRIAEKNDISVDYFLFSAAPALSVSLPGGDCAIALNPKLLDTKAKETAALAHDLGHCMTGAFYEPSSPQSSIGRCEYKADKWAIQNAVSREELEAARQAGYREIYELAEYFDLTEEFMRKVVCWYDHGNLDVDVYYPKAS